MTGSCAMRAAFVEDLAEPRARDLFLQMVAKARDDADYSARLEHWLLKGSTIELRTLSAPFGSYWSHSNQYDFANRVNALDSLHLKMDRWFARFAAHDPADDRIAITGLASKQ